MTPRLYSQVALVVAACCAVLPACADEPVRPNRLNATATVRSVTVFPIVLNSGGPIAGVSPEMSKNVTETVGLLLERAGVAEIGIADANFSPPKDGDLNQTATAFGRFVQSQDLKTEYALFGQFRGAPGKGIDEVRLAVVDPHGKVTLAERLDQQQLELLGNGKVNPLLASYSMVSRLRGPWGLADPNRKDAPEGKMAKLWNEKSGIPSKAEREAMQARLKTFRHSIKTCTVAVYVRISGENDAKAAEKLAKMLTRDGLGLDRAAGADLKLQIKPNTNQTRIAWDTARAFQDFLRKNPPAADFALLADYGIGRSPEGKTLVGGIDYVLCDHGGDWVLLDLSNEHHSDFQRIAPRSADDCNRLVVETLAKAVSVPSADSAPVKDVIPATKEKSQQE